jgi:hypothetical protein
VSRTAWVLAVRGTEMAECERERARERQDHGDDRAASHDRSADHVHVADDERDRREERERTGPGESATRENTHETSACTTSAVMEPRRAREPNLHRSRIMKRAFVLACCVSVGACAPDRDEVREIPEVRPEAPRVGVAQVAHEAGSFVGQRVTIVGEVENVLGPTSFTVSGVGWWLGRIELPIVTAEPVIVGGTTLAFRDEVVVTGVVRPGTREALAPEIGEPDARLAARLDGQPVLVAETIRRVGEVARWSADPEQRTLGLMGVITPENPEAIIGQRVSLQGANVLAVGARSVWIGTSRANRVLVVPEHRAMLSGISPGSDVTVSGVITRLPTADQDLRALGIDQDLPRAERADVAFYIEARQLQARPLPGS